MDNNKEQSTGHNYNKNEPPNKTDPSKGFKSLNDKGGSYDGSDVLRKTSQNDHNTPDHQHMEDDEISTGSHKKDMPMSERKAQ